MRRINSEKVKEDKSFVRWLISYVTRRANEVYVENIPDESIKGLPTMYMYIMGALAYAAVAVTFCYFAYTVYQSGITSRFLSLDPTSGNCIDVKKPITANFIADKNGVWLGDDGFDYSRAWYKFNMVNSFLTYADYAFIMDLKFRQLDAFGQAGFNNSLSLNLMVLVSWSLYCQDGRCDGISSSFTADASSLYRMSQYSGVFSNQQSDCKGEAFYDYANSLLSTNINYLTEYVNNSKCTSVMNPELLGYDAILSGQVFDFALDVRTFSSAFSVSYGIMFMSTLIETTDSPQIEFFHNGYLYTGNWYMDSEYFGMIPMLCIRNNASDGFGSAPPVDAVNDLCFAYEGTTLGLALFMHTGGTNLVNGGIDFPMPCWCGGEYAGHLDKCNAMDFISSFLFFNTNSSLTDQALVLLDVVVSNGNFALLNDAAYNASWASASSSFPDGTHPIYNDTVFRNESYQFCYSSILDMGCSLMTMQMYGDTVIDNGVNKYMVSVENGSCNDILSVPDATAFHIYSEIPTPLVEDYVECTLLPSDSFINAIGIAVGNAGFFVPLALLVLMPFVYMWLYATGSYDDEDRYSDKEVDDTVKELAILLLDVKNGRSCGLSPRSSVIHRLLKEMAKAEEGENSEQDSDFVNERAAQPTAANRVGRTQKDAPVVKYVNIECFDL